MATTDGRLAVALLDVLDRIGTPYRLLHGSDRLFSGGELSDIDIAVAERPDRVLARLIEHAPGGHGLVLIMLWEYDTGALTSFWSTSDASEGVQLDLLRDPSGYGRYGLRTDMLFQSTHTSDSVWPPRLAPLSESVYLLSKRTLKGDRDRTEQIVERARAEFGEDALRATVGSLLSGSARRRCERALDGITPTPADFARVIRYQRFSLRGLRRLRYPSGYVAAVAGGGAGQVQAVASAFRRFLVDVRVDDSPGPAGVLRRMLLARRPVLVLRPALNDGEGVVDPARERARVIADMARVVAVRLDRRLRIGPR